MAVVFSPLCIRKASIDRCTGATSLLFFITPFSSQLPPMDPIGLFRFEQNPVKVELKKMRHMARK